MSKISELSDGGSLVSTDYLIAVRSGGNVKVRMDEINVDQVDLGDNEFIRLGNSQDLTLVHNASNSIINQAGIGDLLIQKAGSTKLTVNSTGIDVTGVITTDGLTSVGGFISIGADGAGDDFRFYGDTSGRYMEWVSAADSLLFRDGAKALFGNGSDLQIYHDGSHSYVSDQGTGNLRIYANDLVLANNDGSETFLYGVNGGGVSISYANSAKVTTTATGIDVTGTVTTTGSVGIGTDLPVQKLSVSGASGSARLSLERSNANTTGGVGSIQWNALDGHAVAGIIAYGDGNDEGAHIAFNTTSAASSSDVYVSTTEAIRIDSSGRLMVNQTSVSAAAAGIKMQVASDILTTGPSAGYFWENRSGMTISAQSGWGGWYSTGTTSHFLYSDGTNKASINRTSGTYTALSDVNKKKDFEDSSVGLAAIMQLQPKKFRMLDDADDAPKYLGFVAQDVENVIPEAYVEDTSVDAGGVENTFIGLTDRPFIAALVKAIQEQQAIIDSLTARIEALES